MHTQLDDGQYLYCAQNTVSLMPTVALLFDRHSGCLLARGIPARVHGRYEQLDESARRAGYPELEQCMVYWQGQFCAARASASKQVERLTKAGCGRGRTSVANRAQSGQPHGLQR